MSCIREVIADQIRDELGVEDWPVILFCPCEKCGNVELDGPVISLKDIE